MYRINGSKTDTTQSSINNASLDNSDPSHAKTSQGPNYNNIL